MRRLATVVFLALLAAGCSTSNHAVAPSEHGQFDDAEQLREAAQLIVNRYASQLEHADAQPPYVPRVVVKTTPGLIFFTRDERSITVPLWSEVPPEARAIFASFAGGDAAKAELLFRRLFNWFFIPHEASHWVQAERGGALDHYGSEVQANDLAVAFWRSNPRNEERLAALEHLLAEVVGRVPDPTPPGMTQRDYFNNHYDELGQDPMKYGYFQFRFVLDSLRRRGALRFTDEVRKVVRD